MLARAPHGGQWAHFSWAFHSSFKSLVAPLERNEVRWLPGKEASLARPCSNLSSFGSKRTVLKKVLVTLLGLFRFLRSDSSPGELYPLTTLVTPPAPLEMMHLSIFCFLLKLFRSVTETVDHYRRRIFIFGALGYFKLGPFWKVEMAVVTFSESDSVPVPNFLSPDPGPKIFKIENPSGYHRCNRNSAVFLPKKCLMWKAHRLLVLKMNSCRFFTNFWLRRRVRKKNAGYCRNRLRHFGSVATSGVDPSGTLKTGLFFSITARSASALAVAFFRLLEPLSYVRFDILKLMQVSLL